MSGSDDRRFQRIERPLPPNPVRGLGLGRPTARLLRSAFSFRGNARGSRNRMLDFQRIALRELLRASSRVPMYADSFARLGVDPSREDPFEVLEALPLLARMNLRSEPWRRRSMPGAKRERMLEESTSGSTGTRMHFWRDPFEAHVLRLLQFRAFRAAGVRPSDRIVELKGVFLETKGPLGISKWRQRIGWFRTDYVSFMQPPEDILGELSASRPDVLIGYASVVHKLAQQRSELSGSWSGPRVIFVGGEMLSSPMRSSIEKAFRCRVVECYASIEFHLLASQCPESERLHVVDDSVVLEILRDGGPVEPGGVGEVVVTGLHGYTAPLIRYRVGDLAVRGPSPCPCGAPFSTLEQIRGRSMEYFSTADGDPVHYWTASRHLFAEISHLDFRPQIVQHTPLRIEVRLSLDQPLDDSRLEEIARRGRQVFGSAMQVDVAQVDEIPCTPSGKLMKAVNLVESPWLNDKWDPASWDRWRGGSSSEAEDGLP